MSSNLLILPPRLLGLLALLLLPAGCNWNAPALPPEVAEKLVNFEAKSKDPAPASGPERVPPVVVDDDLPPGGEDQPDDAGPPARTPLIRGVEKLMEPSIRGEAKQGLRTQLRAADDTLAEQKASNLAAIREANRQQRMRGEALPNIVLLCTRGQLHPANVFAKGTRLSGFPQGQSEAMVAWSVMTGRVPPKGNDQPLTLNSPVLASAVLWNAGYSTGLVGDCTLSSIAADAAVLEGFETWYGYRSPEEWKSGYPEQVWSNGARLALPDNAAGKQGQKGSELLWKETRQFLQRNQRGRPFYLCLWWPGKSESGAFPPIAGGQALLDELNRLGLASRTIVFALDADAQPPLAVLGPKQSAGKLIAEPCGPQDLLPTWIEITRAARKPKPLDGKSLVRLLSP